MSWQCSKCETVNQDVTPVCMVCDSLAPVIESYLSLKSIEASRIYSEKLDEIHRLEVEGEYDRMLTVALEAIAVYKENGLAVEKAKKALSDRSEAKLKAQLVELLNSAIDKDNYLAANTIIEIIERFHFYIPDLSSLKSKVKAQIDNENDVNEILEKVNREIINLRATDALKIVVEGVNKHPTNILLQKKLTDINHFKSLIEEKKKNRPNRPVYKPGSQPNREKTETDGEITSLGRRPKFPKPNRK